MAPEQVEAKEADARTDIFSFGAVVYEMTTGKKAFAGKTSASVMAKILETDPPSMASLQPVTPPALDRVVRKCLAKEPDQRWQTASDLCGELKWIAEGGSQAGATPAISPSLAKPWKRLAWAAATLVSCVVIGVTVWNLKPTPTPSSRPVTRTVITLPPGQQLAGLNDAPALALSPDGTHLAYVATLGSAQQIYLRAMDSLVATPVVGTEGAINPFFSPDGQWLGFFSGGKLRKVSVNGGAAVALGDATQPRGASWGGQGMIAFEPAAITVLQQVADAGGTPQPLVPLGKGEPGDRWPDLLPGSKAVLFTSEGPSLSAANMQVAVQSIGTGERHDLSQTGTLPRYAPSGHLLYAQGGSLIAVPFDPQRLTITGARVPVVEGIMQSENTGAAQYSISSTGSLIYVPGGAQGFKVGWCGSAGMGQSSPCRPPAGLPVPSTFP